MELGHLVTGSVGHLGHLSHESTFGVHYRTGSPGQLMGLRVAGAWIPGSLDRWVTKCGPVPCLEITSLSLYMYIVQSPVGVGAGDGQVPAVEDEISSANCDRSGLRTRRSRHPAARRRRVSVQLHSALQHHRR